MNYLDLQTELAELTLDTSAKWIAGWTGNKNAILWAYWYVYDLLKNAERVKRKIFIQKTKIDFANKIATLPTDFDVIDRVSWFDFTVNSDILWDYESNSFYYDFEITGLGTATSPKKMILNDQIDSLYVSYVPKINLLASNTDVPNLPSEIHNSITDFALFRYYRLIRDNWEASGALNIAQQILNEKLARLW